MLCSFPLKVHMHHLCTAHITIRMWFPLCVKQDTKLCVRENSEKKIVHLRLTYLLQTACALNVLCNTNFCKESLAAVQNALYV